MNIVDKLLEYMETKNQKNLLSKIEMSDYELNVVVVNILIWTISTVILSLGYVNLL